jgi:hypothetical protein
MARKFNDYMLNNCAHCGYVVGATCGYAQLTKKERAVLLNAGYELGKNVHGDEIARKDSGHFNSARFEFHRVQCRPTIFDRLLSNS